MRIAGPSWVQVWQWFSSETWSCVSQVIRAVWNVKAISGSDASDHICSLIYTDSPSRPQIVTVMLRTIMCPLVGSAY